MSRIIDEPADSDDVAGHGYPQDGLPEADEDDVEGHVNWRATEHDGSED